MNALITGVEPFGADSVKPSRQAGVWIDGLEIDPGRVRRCRIWFVAIAGMATAMSLAGPAGAEPSAAAAITECDRLAASPMDRNREGPGVAFQKIDATAAIASCAQALAQNPNNPRMISNLGRANQRAGRLDEAARLYKLAADQGHAGAQYNLGVFYDQGLGGLAKDEREAARLYKLAADQGLAAAQFNFGLLYEAGRGGLAKDDKEAARLFKLAADQGHEAAQQKLARLGIR